MPGTDLQTLPTGQQSVIDWKVFLINSGGAADDRVRRLVAVCCHRSCVHVDTHTHSRERALSGMLSSMTTNCYVGFGFGFTRAYTTAELAQTENGGPCDLLCSEKGPRNCFWFRFSCPSCLSVLQIDFLHISKKALLRCL